MPLFLLFSMGVLLSSPILYKPAYVLPGTGSSNISALPNQTLIFQSHDQLSSGITSTLQVSPQPNANPFYVKFIAGNMRVCQGCRGNLKRQDGSIPASPFDVCAARAERRSFRDSNGILITPQKAACTLSS